MARVKRTRIVGLDGEGIGRNPHLYTLLAWSDEQGNGASKSEPTGLSTFQCLKFLLDMPPDVQPFGYYLQYDWTMMLRDLPNKSLYALFRPEIRKLPKDEGGGFSFVRWRPKGQCEFELHYLAGMMRIKQADRSLTVWDVGRFYQAPFCHRDSEGKLLGALPTWQVGTKKEWDRIADMKARRSTFSKKDREEIECYCRDECRLLAELVRNLNEAHEQIGLKLSSWHGPGSTAGAALKKWGIATKRGDIPEPVQKAAACAFFGGRFEHQTQGIIEAKIFGRDIISAYPAECVALPCLEHGVWHHTEKERVAERATHALVRFELKRTKFERHWGPLPIRLPNGTIVFPHSGASGWVWWDEYEAARAWKQVKFVDAWTLNTDCMCQPFSGIADLFLERNRVGRKSGAGLTLKLCYNSCYGKLAQSIGNPPYRSEIWAGMITSGTRAKLLGPIEKYDGDILAVATDGIYSSVELDVDCGERLGQWEPADYERITLVRPGIYWTEKSTRARGVGRKSLSESKKLVEAALKRGDEMVELPSVQQFGGALSCVYRTPNGELKRNHRYGQWYDRPVRISLDPRPKRAPNYALWELPDIESMPYRSRVVSPDAEKLKKAAELAWGNAS